MEGESVSSQFALGRPLSGLYNSDLLKVWPEKRRPRGLWLEVVTMGGCRNFLNNLGSLSIINQCFLSACKREGEWRACLLGKNKLGLHMSSTLPLHRCSSLCLKLMLLESQIADRGNLL